MMSSSTQTPFNTLSRSIPLLLLFPFLCQGILDTFVSPWNRSISDTGVAPFFWHIPKAGGTTVKFFIECLTLVDASHYQPIPDNDPLRIIKGANSRLIVNVDFSSPTGISDAAQRGFGSFIANNSTIKSSNVHGQPVLNMMIASPMFHDTVNQLLTDVPSTLFTLFRHPVERAVSMFYYVQHADWETTYRPELGSKTLIEFYQNDPMVERDWMTYMLSVYARKDRDPSLPLGEDDFQYAKTIVEQKVLVGLMDHMDESLRRFGQFFGWQPFEEWNPCVSRFSQHGINAHAHPKIYPGSVEWQLIAEANTYDMRLYEVALRVFEEQSLLFKDSSTPKKM